MEVILTCHCRLGPLSKIAVCTVLCLTRVFASPFAQGLKRGTQVEEEPFTRVKVHCIGVSVEGVVIAQKVMQYNTKFVRERVTPRR